MNKLTSFVQTRRAKLAALAALSVASLPALADSTAAVTAINEAKTDGLAVAAAIVGLTIAVWGAMYIKRFFSR